MQPIGLNPYRVQFSGGSLTLDKFKEQLKAEIVRRDATLAHLELATDIQLHEDYVKDRLNLNAEPHKTVTMIYQYTQDRREQRKIENILRQVKVPGKKFNRRTAGSKHDAEYVYMAGL